MKVCASCWSYAKLCSCNNQHIVTIDDDFVDIVIGLNKVFHKLDWNIRTLFCCAGHIAPVRGNSAHAYIMFEGDRKYFPILYDKFANLELHKFGVEHEIDHFEYFKFALHIRNNKHILKMTLEEKINFLKARNIFLEFLTDKIHYLNFLASYKEIKCNDK